MVRKGFSRDGSLYLVLTEEYGRGRPALDLARRTIAGGIDVLQMREKDKSRRDLLRRGKGLALLCRANGVLFIVNDDPCLARRLRADGVHLGQEDKMRWPIREVRRMLGPHRIIGVSTHTVTQFREANASDVDYIAFGPIFPTQTKPYHIGTDSVAEVLAMAAKPVVFIGGIQKSNADELFGQGACHVAMIRDILEADDVEAQARWYRKRITARPGSPSLPVSEHPANDRDEFPKIGNTGFVEILDSERALQQPHTGPKCL